ncbi:MAG: pantoate--beta-alanine ligase [candidate division NC10 bacterium]|nr:pantoate--beta-alanine ligase [candidate division NC10 bacterium]MBI2455997.1 pantoate--beta-alanine ligase [candidate division NC10 bacterium]
METIQLPEDMQRRAGEYRRARRSIGLVPTMGALHEGHLSLIRRCRAENDVAVMSLFVNPAQFNRKDDLERYPRDLEGDSRMAREAGVDVIFAPTAEGMYPDGYVTYLNVERITERWEGTSRPGHFRGVATVCTKLFTICRPHRAYFGQKDYQQSLVVRRLAADLNLGLEIVVSPTVREPDGLALSSRNVLLNQDERRQATVLYRALFQAQAAVRGGERDAGRVRAAIEAEIRGAPLAVLDYVGVCDPDTLEPLVRVSEKAVAVVAASFGATRLIDNAILDP